MSWGRFALRIAVAIGVAGCVTPLMKGAGTVRTDGRELGLHTDPEPRCANPPIGEPGGVIGVKFWVGSRSYGTVRFSPQAKAEGIDVQLPWSHVTFKPTDCSLLDVTIEHRAGTETVKEGNAGSVRAKCKLPDSTDSFEMDFDFEGC